jgi:PAS domain S-box-containing protein
MIQSHPFTELQESEARFRAAFQSSAIGMGLLALDGKILQVNDAVLRMSGYTEDELLQRYDQENVYPEDRNIGMDLFPEVMDGSRDWFQVEKRYVRKNGEVFWTRLTTSAVRDPQGKVLYFVGLIDDIDVQKRMLENLQASETRFRAIFNDSVVGIGVLSLERRLIDVNPALCQIFGRTREELLGMSAADVTYPDDNPESRNLFLEIATGQRDSYETDRRYIRKNGEVFWAHTTMSSVRGPDSKPLYIVGMIADIDEQKKMQERIRESEARFQAMFDNVAIGMALVGFDRRILSVNQTLEQISGYTAEELYRINISDLVYPEDMNVGMEEFRDLVAGKRENMQMERRYVRKNGEMYWAGICYSLVRNSNGKPQYLVGSLEDITERKMAAQTLAEQESRYRRALEQRVEERTHELAETNQRLHEEIEQRLKIEEELADRAADEAVTTERTRLARDLHDAVTQTLFSATLTAEVLPDLWEVDVEEAKKSTEELRQLTRGALAEMRTLLLELRPAALTQTRLSDLIKQLCEAFIGRSRLPITLTVEGERNLPPEVQVAFYRIAQESLNNVFKYARATKVDVSLFMSPAGVHFNVCDDGIGFDMAVVKPTSLGRRIMRERAEAIGGHFALSSEPGKGTCVEVEWIEKPDMKLSVFKK